MSEAPAPDSVAYLNEHLGGYNRAMGLRITCASADEVEAEIVIGEQHLQPYGVVHGGVHAGMIEAACSTGAALVAMKNGQAVVGLENATSFLRAAREGTLRVTAVPVVRGRRSQVWEATVRDELGRPLATGRVRLMCLEPGEVLAGKKVGV
jgi:uncharacterized protein (TIGR00369 family)